MHVRRIRNPPYLLPRNKSRRSRPDETIGTRDTSSSNPPLPCASARVFLRPPGGLPAYPPIVGIGKIRDFGHTTARTCKNHGKFLKREGAAPTQSGRVALLPPQRRMRKNRSAFFPPRVKPPIGSALSLPLRAHRLSASPHFVPTACAEALQRTGIAAPAREGTSSARTLGSLPTCHSLPIRSTFSPPRTRQLPGKPALPPPTPQELPCIIHFL